MYRDILQNCIILRTVSQISMNLYVVSCSVLSIRLSFPSIETLNNNIQFSSQGLDWSWPFCIVLIACPVLGGKLFYMLSYFLKIIIQVNCWHIIYHNGTDWDHSHMKSVFNAAMLENLCKASWKEGLTCSDIRHEKCELRGSKGMLYSTNDIVLSRVNVCSNIWSIRCEQRYI